MFKLFDAFFDKNREADSSAVTGSFKESLITEEQLEKALLTQKKEKKGLMEALTAT